MFKRGIVAIVPLICASLAAVAVAARDETAQSTADDFDYSSSLASLFDFEDVQLTDDLLRSLAEEHDDLQDFDFANIEISMRQSPDAGQSKCKVFPGDKAWPSKTAWKLFKHLLGGALLNPAPLASVCYDGAWGPRDEEDCARITAEWTTSELHYEHPTSIMAQLLQGDTCPPSSGDGNCTIGALPVYVVEATTVKQIQLAVNFARNRNLRLVVKNTGHDFGGKSVGAGALSVWTHRLKDVKFFEDYQASGYRGPAFKMGAGIQIREMYEAADEQSLIVVAGEGKTVGGMGGYTMGGGHSPFSSVLGLGADQVLSVEVVRPDGRFVTASKENNPDLFWALCGGGGGTFGIVTSMIVRAHPKPEKMGALTFTLLTGPELSEETFWEALRIYFKQLADFTDKGFYQYFYLFNFGGGNLMFDMKPWFAPNMSASMLKDEAAPLFEAWKEIGVNVEPRTEEYTSFLNLWEDHLGSETAGSRNTVTSSRLFPRENFLDEAKFNETWDDGIKWAVEKGHNIIGFAIGGKPAPGHGLLPDNSVNPAWRRAAMHAITATTWDDSASQEERSEAAWELTHVITERWRQLTPGSGAYMSEADPSEPNFQQSFYGDKYNRLYEIKQELDPKGLLYVHTGVGSEDWYVTGQDANIPTQNGRLCRKH